MVKSAELDELKGKDLLSEYSPVRWVITKAALMEGWDCPFAYLLVMLDNTQAARALTQLVGRVMRQPHARRTGRELLDRCYVYCWNTDVSTAVIHIKNGLEQEGLTGLAGDVLGAAMDLFSISVQRRQQFQGQQIFLPWCCTRRAGGWRELDYQRHMLSTIDWSAITAPDPQASLPDRATRQSATVDVGSEPPVFHGSQELEVDRTASVSWFTRRDLRRCPESVAGRPHCAGPVRAAAGQRPKRRRHLRPPVVPVHALREYVTDAVEKQAERAFGRKLRLGEIRFDLNASEPNFKMVDNYEIRIPTSAGLLARSDGQPIQFSLFEPAYDYDLNTLERNFARYLDEQKALQWWHRVAVRQHGDYYLRGWKQERVWPDFIAMGSANGGNPHFLVFETKGEHLSGSADTDYKRRLLDALQNALSYGTMTVQDGPAKGTFQLVFSEAEFPKAMAILQP